MDKIYDSESLLPFAYFFLFHFPCLSLLMFKHQILLLLVSVEEEFENRTHLLDQENALKAG